MKIIKRYIFCLVLFFTTISILFADPVDKDTAKKAAQMWIKVNSKAQSNTVEECVEKIYHGYTACYIFILNKGFVIISGSNNVKPVLAYSFTSMTSKKDAPPAFEHWINMYSKQIIEAEKNSYRNTDVRKEWEQLLSGTLTINPSKNINPILSTLWNQNQFYNAACPADASGPDGHTYVGCTAVAMGQVIKYFGLPITGEGSYSYWHVDYGEQSAEFDNTIYRYDEMPDQLSDYNDATAEFLYHCAVSLTTDFGPNGSGVSNFDAVAWQLQNRFKYSQADYQCRPWYNTSEWVDLLKNEMDHGRPVIYRSTDTQGNKVGHAWVCDGYDNNVRFHFNWGWGGNHNGYYDIDDLTPGSHDYNHDTKERAIIGIYPDCPASYLWLPNTTIYGGMEKGFEGRYSVCAACLNSDYFRVNDDAETVFKAGVWIGLKNGFHAKRGSSFHAYIGDIIDNCEYRETSDTYEQDNEDPGIENKKSNSEILSVYPNPNDGKFTTSFHNNTEICIEIKVINMLGKTVKDIEVFSNNAAIDISDYPKGIYFVKAKAGEQIFTEKIIYQ